MTEKRYGNARAAVSDSRVRVPARFRAMLGEFFSIIPGKGGCVYLIPAENEEAVLGSILQNVNPYLSSNLEETVKRNMTDVEVDDQNRFTIDAAVKNMCSALDSAKEVVFTGGGLYVELWPAAVYDDKYGRFNASEFDSLIANLRASVNKQ